MTRRRRLKQLKMLQEAAAIPPPLTWRDKAAKWFPEFRSIWSDPDGSVYTLFRELMMLLIDSHNRGDDDVARSIYDFAEWCFFQEEDGDVSNAAGVVFYEHLADHVPTREQMPIWMSLEFFEDVGSICAWCIGPEAFARLQDRFLEYNFKTTEPVVPSGTQSQT